MARRANAASVKAEQTVHTTIHGGEIGVPPPADMKTSITMPGVSVASAYRAPDPDAPPPPEVKRYRVLNEITIMSHGCKTLMRTGKEVDDVSYDISNLERQGVRLQPLGA